MLFNSYAFIFGFLPILLIGYSIAGLFHRKAVVIWLGLASLAFYAYWHPAFLLILGGSILGNFLFGRLISRAAANTTVAKVLLWLAIVANLSLLGWFKYLFPFLGFIDGVFHTGQHPGSVLLPLGISFFTFTQIAYLVDLQQGVASDQDFSSYLLFVTFFPHLIAGPILHHKDIMPQFQEDRTYRLRFNDLAVGFTWFVMGLFKKVVLADRFAPTADMVFAAHGATTSGTAWIGVLSYALQLYFDFSGYCDMACGLARMLSIDFPLNFSSPYKAFNIIDFWQRWHMTLTQYIGAYLYSPIQFMIVARRRRLGKKVTRRAQATPEGFFHMVAVPTIFTMFIVGIWHGAGLQFLVFGLLHGIYLTVAHGWRLLRPEHISKASPTYRDRLVHGVSVLLTFLCVVQAQIFFRAPSTRDAVLLLQRMTHLYLRISAPTVAIEQLRSPLMLLTLGFIIVWCFPNTQQILARYKPALRLAPADGYPRLLPIYWAPSVAWGMLLGSAFTLALIRLQNPSTFLYFQF
jgi:D-alanyl-lipoteichoic acid acyltransferase DltB (MBOAT superfamily)